MNPYTIVEGAVPSTPVANEIAQFFHCGRCIKELPIDQSPQEYRRYDIGWTKQGFQVWCTRHNCNVIHVDFEGARHPAELRA